MNWEQRVQEWLEHPVTKAFFAEIKEDEQLIVEALISTTQDENGSCPSSEEYMIYRGMIKAFRGILGMGLIDSIRNPDEKE